MLHTPFVPIDFWEWRLYGVYFEVIGFGLIPEVHARLYK